jgi:hypothetical protein
MADPIDAIQFPISIDRALGQLKKERDYARYVNQLIRQVLLTAPGERAHRPEFGAGLRRMVFSPNDEATASLLETIVLQNLNRWLGDLIKLENVTARAENNVLRVTIAYVLKARGTSEILNLEVTL